MIISLKLFLIPRQFITGLGHIIVLLIKMIFYLLELYISWWFRASVLALCKFF